MSLVKLLYSVYLSFFLYQMCNYTSPTSQVIECWVSVNTLRKDWKNKSQPSESKGQISLIWWLVSRLGNRKGLQRAAGKERFLKAEGWGTRSQAGGLVQALSPSRQGLREATSLVRGARPRWRWRTSERLRRDQAGLRPWCLAHMTALLSKAAYSFHLEIPWLCLMNVLSSIVRQKWVSLTYWHNIRSRRKRFSDRGLM